MDYKTAPEETAMFTYAPDHPTPALRRPKIKEAPMNFNEMPDGNSAAEIAYDRSCQRAEDRQDALREQYPIEYFAPEAIAHIRDEVGYEFLQTLITNCPTTVLCALVEFTGYDRIPSVFPGMADGLKDTLRLAFDGWIANEAERLKEEAIEGAR